MKPPPNFLDVWSKASNTEIERIVDRIKISLEADVFNTLDKKPLQRKASDWNSMSIPAFDDARFDLLITTLETYGDMLWATDSMVDIVITLEHNPSSIRIDISDPYHM